MKSLTFPRRLMTAAVALVISFNVWAPDAQAGDWPQWRGPDRTDVSAETGLLQEWPIGGPTLLWKVNTLGIGHAGPAIVGDKLYILGDKDDNGKRYKGPGEELHCIDVKTGKTLWSKVIGKHIDNRWGNGPRSTPTVDGKGVYVIGSQGDLVCLSSSDGRKIWTKSLNKLGGKTEFWGYTQSPLIDGDKVIATTGSDGAAVAFDKKTGKFLWKAKPTRDKNHYSSLIAIEHQGVRQYVKLRFKSVYGVAAKDGKVLWSASWHGVTAVIPTPIYKDGHVFICSGYGQGSKLIKLDGRKPITVYDNKAIVNHHGGIVLLGDHLYGYNDGNKKENSKKGWVCVDFLTGKNVWTSGKLSKGSITYADGRFYCRAESDGTVALIEASPKAWVEHGRLKMPERTVHPRKSGKIWVHPVIANGRLYLRDQEWLFCYDIKAK